MSDFCLVLIAFSMHIWKEIVSIHFLIELHKEEQENAEHLIAQQNQF